MSTNLVEGSYFQVLQSAMVRAYRKLPELAPWVGFDECRQLVTNSYAGSCYVSASDFSNTDAHFHLSATMEVCDVLEECFQKQYRAGLRETLSKMHSIPLVIGPKSQMVGEHGVASGSNWTNFIETVFDLLLGEVVRHETNSQTRCLYAIGDDIAWVSRAYDKDLPTLLERIGSDAGMSIKAEKTTNDQDKVKSLQRLFIRGYNRPDGNIRAVYSTIRALKSSVYPERFHKPSLWSSDMFCARQFMILENCVDHPLFEEFVKFVCSGQRDLVPFARKPRKSLGRILRETKLLPGLNPTYNQERRDRSLADFESIRLLQRCDKGGDADASLPLSHL